jgi:hypothetical protein
MSSAFAPTSAGSVGFRGAPKGAPRQEKPPRGAPGALPDRWGRCFVERGPGREPSGAASGSSRVFRRPRSACGGALKKRGRVAPNRGRLALFWGEVAQFGGGGYQNWGRLARLGAEVPPFGGAIPPSRGNLPQIRGSLPPSGGSPAPFRGGGVPLGGRPAPFGATFRDVPDSGPERLPAGTFPAAGRTAESRYIAT